MRVFIAIQLEAEVKEYLSKIQDISRKHSVSGSYSLKENLHLTVRFIGEVTPQLLSQIMVAIEAASQEVSYFDLFTENIGSFPRRNRIILWLGVKGEIGKLQQLYSVLEEKLVKVGITPEDRSYNPHLTLGREIQLKDEIKDIEKELQLEEKQIKVREITLMESTRENGKLVYKPLNSFLLRQNP